MNVGLLVRNLERFNFEMKVVILLDDKTYGVIYVAASGKIVGIKDQTKTVGELRQELKKSNAGISVIVEVENYRYHLLNLTAVKKKEAAQSEQYDVVLILNHHSRRKC